MRSKKTYVSKAKLECKILGFKSDGEKIYSARLLGDRMPCTGCAFYHSASTTHACTKPDKFGSCLQWRGNEYNANIFWLEEIKET